MLAGTVINLAAVVIACTRLSVLFLRYLSAVKDKYHFGDVDSGLASNARRDASRARDVWMLHGLLLSTVFILVRLAYRVAELSTGFGGKIMTTEVYFNVLDGAMVILTMVMLNILLASFTDARGTKRAT